MLLIGYLEGIDSQRGIAWRCEDSRSLRRFLGVPLGKETPNHSSLTRIRGRLPLEIHEHVFHLVLSIIDERARQGWQHSRAPFGYVNVTEDREHPIQPHPEKSKSFVRLFELYSSGRHTFESLADQLAGEGYTYQSSNPRFHRTALSRMLRNRVYIGEIKWGERYFTASIVRSSTAVRSRNAKTCLMARFGEPRCRSTCRWRADSSPASTAAR